MKKRKRREIIVNAFYVHDEKIPEPSCVEESFYDVNDERYYDYLLRMVMKHRNILKPIYHELVDRQELLLFKAKYLKRLIKKLDNKKAIEKCLDIMNDKARHCQRCGAIILDKYFCTYRSNNGCVGLCYECCICRGYSNQAVHEVADYARKNSKKKALLRALKEEDEEE